MQLTIIGAESLGVRGLSCLVRLPDLSPYLQLARRHYPWFSY